MDHDAAWRGIGALYGRPGVHVRCLELQRSDGISVTALLTLVWAAVAGHGPATRQAATEIAAETEAFQAGVLRPLRAARDGLGTWRGRLAGADRTRRRLLDGELEVERLEQALVLERLGAPDGCAPAADPHGDACLSMARYLRLCRPPLAGDRLRAAACVLGAALDDDALRAERALERALAEASP